MIIRSACIEDAGVLAELYSYYVENTAATLELIPPSAEEFGKRIECILNKYPYLVLEDNGVIVGFCYAAAFRVREGYKYSVESSVYVRNGLQKNGYGKLLMNALEEKLRQMGITNINVCIVCSDRNDEHLNRGSVIFHGGLGYSQVGIFHKCAYKFNRWYDVVWMEKHIGEHN